MVGEEFVLRAYAVAVIERLGEIRGVGRGGGFAIAEHCYYDDVVGGECCAGGV